MILIITLIAGTYSNTLFAQFLTIIMINDQLLSNLCEKHFT